MKKLIACLLAALFLMPAVVAFAQDEDEISVSITTMRYRLEHQFQSSNQSNDNVGEYFDDDLDMEFKFERGDLSFSMSYEHADGNYATDYAEQGESATSFIGGYSISWSPEAWADKNFTLSAGDLGNCWGKCVFYPTNEESDRGAINASMTLGTVDLSLEYLKEIEGDTDDDVDGDQNGFRTWFSMPLGESGFSIGGYGGIISGSDVITQEAVEADPDAGTEAVPEEKTSLSGFVGGVEFSGDLESIGVWSEVGFASGTREVTGHADVDLTGFYAMGGADFTVGQITLGVEGGFGSGDDDPDDNEEGDWIGPATDFWIDGIMHDYEAYINGGDGGMNNLTYARVKADMSPTEKLSLFASLAYLMPTEEVGGVDTYGMDFYGSATYTLSDNVSYSLGLWVAMPDEDFVEDTKYIVRNRLQFAF